LGHISGTVDCPAALEERAPCAFRDPAQLASSKFATAQLVRQHVAEGYTLVRWGISLKISLGETGARGCACCVKLGHETQSRAAHRCHRTAESRLRTCQCAASRSPCRRAARGPLEFHNRLPSPS